MANTENEFPLGYIDRRGTTLANRNDAGATSKQKAYESTSVGATVLSVGALRTRLTAIDGTYYNSGRLDQMTKNDMVYAVRLADEALGI